MEEARRWTAVLVAFLGADVEFRPLAEAGPEWRVKFAEPLDLRQHDVDHFVAVLAKGHAKVACHRQGQSKKKNERIPIFDLGFC